MGSSPELHVLHCVNAGYKSRDLVHQSRLEGASTGMPDQRTTPEQRTTCAATRGINILGIGISINFKSFKVCNNLPADIRTTVSLNAFMDTLRNYFEEQG